MAIKFKQLEWTQEETKEYEGAESETYYRSQYVPHIGGGTFYNIVECGGRFYPIWSPFPPEGFETLEQAKSFAQGEFEEDVMEILNETTTEWSQS
jgi:hypothetical protein